MSAIAGSFDRRGGRAATETEIHRMLAHMGHRARDGNSSWSANSIALGHGWLNTTGEVVPGPETLEQGTFAATADCRLDNRDQLLAHLGCKDRTLSDAAIILRAYLRWGEDCPRHLEGDFAFAIWDGEQRLLFCARDHFGIKPFYYHVEDTRFLFASEIRAILAVDGVLRRVNEHQIAGFLAGLPDDPQSTSYKDIFRLPPRHSLTIAPERVSLRPYWQLESAVRPHRRDAAEEFRHLFARAVQSRLRGTAHIGAMLSGGLDSSAICGMAMRSGAGACTAPLSTYSLVFEQGSAMDERRYIDAVLAGGDFDSTFIPVRDYVPFAQFEDIIAEQEGTFLAPGLPLTRRIYDAARCRGVRVLLDGHGGDEVVSHGYGRLHELASDRRWLDLWRESRGPARIFGKGRYAIFLNFFMQYGPGWRLAGIRRAAESVRGHVLPRRSRGTARGPAWRDLVHRDFEIRTNLLERYRMAGVPSPTTRASEMLTHRWTLANGIVPHAFEVLDKTAATFGIEPRYPFWDKSLVEFCLSLPAEEKLSGGWTRHLLRRAMEGILPPEVQWRCDKIDFKPALASGMVRHHRSLIEGVLGSEGERVAAYVNLPAVRAAFERLCCDPVNPGMDDIQYLWRTVSLSTWLRQLEHGT